MITWRCILQSARDSIGGDAGTADIILKFQPVSNNPRGARTVREESKLENEQCPNTGMDVEDCPCMWCHPPVFFFKYLVADYDCKSISGVLRALRDRQAFFKKLKEDGFRLTGPVDDHYASFEPPDSEDFYWVECRSGGCYLRFSQGEIPPAECPECGKNLYEYEI